MERFALWEVLRPRLLMIVAITIITGIAGYGLTLLMHDQYAAVSLILVRPRQQISIDTNKSTKEVLDFPLGQSSVVETPSKTYIEIMKSPALAEKVVRTLHLDQEARKTTGRLTQYLPAALRNVADRAKESIAAVSQILKYGRTITEDRFSRAVKEVQDDLSLKTLSETYVFEVKFTASEPQRAAQVANTTTQLFVDLMENLRREEIRAWQTNLTMQLEQRRVELDEARQRLQNYKQEHSVFLYESEHSAKLREIADLELELAKIEQSVAGARGSLTALSSDAKRARLVRLLADHKAELVPLPGIEHQLKDLELEVKTAANAYEVVDKEVREAEIKYSYATPEVRIVSAASIPQLPAGPARLTIVAACLFCGLTVAVTLAFLLQYLDKRVRGIADIEDLVGAKVLGTIPRFPANRKIW